MNYYKRAQRGMTLFEIAVAIVLLTIFTAAVFPLMGNLIEQVRWFRAESFKEGAGEAMVGYQTANAHQFANLTVVATVSAADIARFGTGSGAKGVGRDDAGRIWRYIRCATGGTLSVGAYDIEYCDLMGYTTNGGVTYPDGVSAPPVGESIAWWRNHADIDDIMIVSGLPVVQAKAQQTQTQLTRVRTAMEEYYRSLYLASVDKGIGINRFANTSATTLTLLFDADSVLRNTESSATDNHLFTTTEAGALGLTPSDLNTPFGEIQFDNGSVSVRSPDNNNLVPYTTRLWVTLPDGTVMDAIAKSSIQ